MKKTPPSKLASEPQSDDGSEAVPIRAAVRRSINGEPPKKGGILAALRRSPLVGADLDLARSREGGR
jgi:hypothetical protein